MQRACVCVTCVLRFFVLFLKSVASLQTGSTVYDGKHGLAWCANCWRLASYRHVINRACRGRDESCRGCDGEEVCERGNAHSVAWKVEWRPDDEKSDCPRAQHVWMTSFELLSTLFATTGSLVSTRESPGSQCFCVQTSIFRLKLTYICLIN